MVSKGVIFKCCTCDTGTGRRRSRSCPDLSRRDHGSWYFDCRVPDLWGHSKQVRHGGFPSRAAASRARDEVQALSREELAGHSWTLEQWLRYWLSTRTALRPTTLRVYTQHVDDHLIPLLGQVRLAQLSARQVTTAFTTLATNPTRTGSPLTAGTVQRIRATLRAALNAAIREGLITDNLARRVELPPGPRPHPVVWTPERIAAWQRHGDREPVMVWTPEQLATFLDRVAADRLYALWWLIALRGLRRGEAAGLRWCDLDLTHHQLTVSQQRTTAGPRVVTGPPKSAASRRTIALDKHTVTALREHQRRQAAEQRAAGAAWVESGYVFTRRDGQPLHPGYLTQRFTILRRAAGLPPVRLHDLRHGAASLAHAAGTDLKTVQAQLGHASIVLTADTYTSVLPAVQHKAAAATARLVLTAARSVRAAIRHGRNEYGEHPGDSRPDGPDNTTSGTGPVPTRPPGKRRRGKRTARTHRPHRTKHGRKTAGQRVGRQGLEP
jgi:integrase